VKQPSSPTIRHALKKARTAVEAPASDPAPLEADGLPAGEDDTVDVPGGKVAKGNFKGSKSI
jgi:hypothetical protein